MGFKLLVGPNLPFDFIKQPINRRILANKFTVNTANQ